MDEDQSELAKALVAGLVGTSALVGVLACFGAGPELLQPVTLQIMGLVIGYLAAARGQGPELRL